MPSTRALIHAPWSASKVAMALRCPRLFHFRYVDKLKEPEVMPELRLGKAVHSALELVLQGSPLVVAMEQAALKLQSSVEHQRFTTMCTGIEPFLLRVGEFRKRKRVTRQLIEYSLAVRDDLSPTQFYAGDAYFRGVVDLGYLWSDELALIDHKSGSRYPGQTVADQLEGYAVLATASFRTVRRLWLGIHWVGEAALEWNAPVDVSEVRERMTANLLDNIEAAALAVSDGPRTNPGPYCERCSYRSVCPASDAQRFEELPDEHDD